LNKNDDLRGNYFWTKFQFLTKMKIFDQKFVLWLKRVFYHDYVSREATFYSNLEILPKRRHFRQAVKMIIVLRKW